MGMVEHFLYQNAEVAVWKVEESESFYIEATGLQSLIKSDKRRLEFYAGRYLLKHMIPHLDLFSIKIDHIGKPYLSNHEFQFSISHSYPYIAVAIHEHQQVGIDIQMYRDKILRLQSKFLNEKEFALNLQSVEEVTLLWNAKEALFKWRATGGQDFSEQLNINAVDPKSEKEFIMDCTVTDPDGKIHPVTLLGKTEETYSLAIAVGRFNP